MKFYTKRAIKKLREKVDIVELISQFIPLKQCGDVYKTCCPFHDEKSPSFVVDGNKGLYHCYGCQAHGDVIAFLMNYKLMSFKDALFYLEEFYKNKKKGVSMSECKEIDKTSEMDSLKKSIDELRGMLKSIVNGQNAQKKVPEKKNSKKSDVTYSAEEEFLMRCAQLMDYVSKFDNPEKMTCTSSDLENKYKILSAPKLRYIIEKRKELGCEDCFDYGLKTRVIISKFIRWVMENVHQYKFLLNRYSYPNS
jgi:hypothetical protein